MTTADIIATLERKFGERINSKKLDVQDPFVVIDAKDRLTIKDNRFDMKIGKDTMLGTFTLDAAKDPKHIDTHITTGAMKGQKSLGIYYFSGQLYVLSNDTATMGISLLGSPNANPKSVTTATLMAGASVR